MNEQIKENKYISNYCFLESDIESLLSCDVLTDKNLDIIITIDDYKFPFINKLNKSEIRRYFFTLSNYPKISEWELHQLYLFIQYENAYNRKVGIWCANIANINLIKNYMSQESHIIPEKPNKLTACTACKHNGLWCKKSRNMH